MKNLIKAHCEAYPKLRARDLLKLVYQSSYGCEHLLSDVDSATERITEEHARLAASSPRDIECIGDYCRVPLSYLDRGLSPRTLAQLFCLSAAPDAEGDAKLECGLSTLTELAESGEIAISLEELSREISAWREAGFPAVSHSEKFRTEYSPSYRVISKRYADFLPLLAAVDRMLERGRVRLAIDGGAASGKSTLAELLSKIYDATVFHADDFFLRPEQRTPERFAEPGGNLDRERLRDEILLPLSLGETVNYRPFLCSSFTLGEEITVEPTRLTVIEGSYSMHPELSGFYDLSAFLDISRERQAERIRKRNSPALAERFFAEWIPLENRYFEAADVMARCDVVIRIL